MAKQENFDFDTDSSPKAKAGLNLDFLNKIKFLEKLTDSQKKLIFFSAILIVVTIIICVVLLIVSANGGFNGLVNNDGGSSVQGGTGNNGGQNSGGSESDGNDDSGNNSGSENDSDIGIEIPSDMNGFSISTPPTNTTYFVGDTPDYSGLSIFYTSEITGDHFIDYLDHPEAFVITGFDSSKPVESQTITVKFGEQSATFTISIREKPVAKATLKSIHLDPAPVSECKVGYPPDLRGSSIVCVYSDGTTKTVTLAYENLSNYEEDLDAAQIGDQVTIKVVVKEDGYVAETSFTVTMVE